MTDYLKSYNLTIETLTPAHVGSGEQLDKFEYVIKDGSLFVIDYDSLAEDVKIRQDLVRELDRMLTTRWNNESISNYSNFLSRTIQSKPQYLRETFEMTSGAEMALTARNARGVGEIWMMPSSGGKYYIPGSSIKGAIRTAMIFKWMSQEDRVAWSGRAAQLRDDINRLSNERGTHNSTKSKYRELEKISNELLETYSEFKRGPNHFRHLRVADIPLSSENLRIELIQRKHFKAAEGERGIPNYAQIVKESSFFRGQISLLTGSNRFDLSKIRKACNDAYVPIMEQFGSMNDNFSKELQEKFILPIGKFAGALGKTLDGMRCINVMPPPKRGEVPFKLEQKPKTYNEVSEDGNILGWILCALEEK